MQPNLTVQAVIDMVLRDFGVERVRETVDTIKTGSGDQVVSGIVTTFLATRAVIQQAVERNANLIITHEPTFYDHHDDTGWLEDDPVYLAKRRLIDEHEIVIWRLHDYIHRARPTDGIIAGVLEELGWEAYAQPDRPKVCAIPPVSLANLAAALKQRLQVTAVRIAGDPGMACRRVALVVGAPGGRAQIDMLAREDVDVVIAGESPEWVTCEYVRDARDSGIAKGLVVVGHANSEEAGMRWLAGWLRERLPEIPITHIPAGDPFHVV